MFLCWWKWSSKEGNVDGKKGERNAEVMSLSRWEKIGSDGQIREMLSAGIMGPSSCNKKEGKV